LEFHVNHVVFKQDDVVYLGFWRCWFYDDLSIYALLSSVFFLNDSLYLYKLEFALIVLFIVSFLNWDAGLFLMMFS